MDNLNQPDEPISSIEKSQQQQLQPNRWWAATAAPVLILASIVLYLMSLFGAVAQYGNHVTQTNQYYDPHLPIFGLHALLFGPVRFVMFSSENMLSGSLGTIFHCIGMLGWFANPLCFIALICMGSRKWSYRLASSACVLATICIITIGSTDPYRVLGDPYTEEPLHLMGASFVWYGSVLLFWIATRMRHTQAPDGLL